MKKWFLVLLHLILFNLGKVLEGWVANIGAFFIFLWKSRRWGKITKIMLIIVSLAAVFLIIKALSEPKQTLVSSKKAQFKSIFTANYTSAERRYFDWQVEKYQYIVLDKMTSYDWYKVVRTYQDIFARECQKHNVSFEQAFAHGYMENSGGIAKGSPAGCVGIMQVNAYNARVAGLRVNKQIDQRKDPAKNIHAGVVYLRKLLDLYDNRLDLASSAYHSGEGNMDYFIRLYLEQKGIHLANRFSGSSVTEVQSRNEIMLKNIRKYNIKIADLWRNPKVESAWRTRRDESRWYLLKVAACEKICWLKKNNPNEYIKLRRRYISDAYRWEVFFAEDMDELEDLEEIKKLVIDGKLIKIPNCRLWKINGIGEEDSKNQKWYHYSRPMVFGLLIELGKELKKIDQDLKLVITSLTRTREYQRKLRKSNNNATSGDSLHTFALALDISKIQTFGGNRKSLKEFQKILEKLQAQNKIYWANEGSGQYGCFHISLNPYNCRDYTESYYFHLRTKKKISWFTIMAIMALFALIAITAIIIYHRSRPYKPY